MQRCNVVPESMQRLILSPECIVTIASFETDAISDGFHDGDTGTNCQHLPSTVRLGTGDLGYNSWPDIYLYLKEIHGVLLRCKAVN